MPEYDQRLLDLLDDLRDRFPTPPRLKHEGVPLGALDRDDLIRIVAMLLDEWRETKASGAAARRRGRRST